MIVIAGIVLIFFILWILWENRNLMLHEITITDERIPKEFSNFKIAQISDFHNAEFGDNNCEVIEILKKAKPDIIVITGDLIDSRRTKKELAVSLVKQMILIAPVYYIFGNHELRMPELCREVEMEMKTLGVHMLRGKAESIEKNGELLQIIGIDDLNFYLNDFSREKSLKFIERDINKWNRAEVFSILLSHRPELFETYVKTGVNLVFAGHMHGGQFRIPFLGGICGPNQSFFPKYDAGLFQEKETSMIVSRGIGESVVPFRVNNRPEIILAKLEHI